MPRRWLFRMLLAIGVAATIVALAIWWQDRGLGVVKQRLASGDAEGALAAADSFLRTRPGHSTAITLRARALVAVGRPTEAANLFERVGAAEPEDLRSWSTAWLTLGQWERALPILERLDQLEPVNPETLEAITVCRFELGRLAAAVESARRMAAIPGIEAKGHLQLASIYRDWGYQYEASEHFEQVLAYSPDAEGLDMKPDEFFLVYGDSLLDAGRARSAIEMLSRSNELRPSVEGTLRLGQACSAVGDHAKASEYFQEVLHQDVTNHTAREQLAEIELQREDFDSAVEWLKPLVERDMLTSNTAYLLQRSYTELGADARAQQWGAKATTLRKLERHLAALQTRAKNQRLDVLDAIVQTYQAVRRRDWDLAGKAVASLLRIAPETYSEDFVQQLVTAVQQQTGHELPALELLPPSLQQAKP